MFDYSCYNENIRAVRLEKNIRKMGRNKAGKGKKGL